MHKIYDAEHWGRTSTEVQVILVLILTQRKIRAYFIPTHKCAALGLPLEGPGDSHLHCSELVWEVLSRTQKENGVTVPGHNWVQTTDLRHQALKRIRFPSHLVKLWTISVYHRNKAISQLFKILKYVISQQSLKCFLVNHMGEECKF